MVLAFAIPFFKKDGIVSHKNLGGTSIYLDNSQSMTRKQGDERAFDLGMTYVQDLVEQLPPSSQVALMTNDFIGGDRYFYGPKNIQERLAEVEQSYSLRTLGQVWERQTRANENLGSKEQLVRYVLSDFQKSTSEDWKEEVKDTTSEIYLVPLGQAERSNVYVDSVWFVSPFIREGETVELKARLNNVGDEEIEGLAVRLTVDEQLKASSSVNLPAKGNGIAEFGFTLEGKGFKQCQLVFEDFPVDFDNEYRFVAEVTDKIPVAVVQGKGASSATRKVYASEPMFDLAVMGELGLNFEALEVADVILLDGVSAPDDGLIQAMNKVLEKGGSVVYFPSGNGKGSEVLAQWGINAQKDFDTLSKLMPLRLVDYQNPFYSGVFQEERKDMQMPRAKALLNLGRQLDGLLVAQDGSSFFGRKSFGQGNIYVCASPLANEYTDFEKHALFVPILYKVAMLSTRTNLNPAYNMGTGELVIDGEFTVGMRYQLTGKDLQVIPEQRVVDNKLYIHLPAEVKAPGFYKILDAKEELVTTVALNPDKRESKMDFYSVDELEGMFANYPNIKVIDTSSILTAGMNLDEAKEGFPLWKICLILCLVFLLGETVLLRFGQQGK